MKWHRRMSRSVSWLVLLVVVSLGLAACGASPTPTAVPKTSVSIAFLDDASRDGPLYAIQQGIVTSDTVELNIVWLPLAALIESVGTRQYDAVEGATIALPRARAGGLNLVILSPALENRDGTLLFVPKDSPLQSPADLKGKTIAVTSLGGTFTLETRYVLQQKYGLDASVTGGDVRFVEAPPDTTAVMLKQGQADAGVFLHAPAYGMLQNPDFRVLSDITQEFRDLAGVPKISNSVIYTYQDKLGQKEAALKEAARMLGESMRYFLDNRDDVLAKVAEARDINPDFLTWWWNEAHGYGLGPMDASAKETILAIWQAAQDLGDIPIYPSIDDVVVPSS